MLTKRLLLVTLAIAAIGAPAQAGDRFSAALYVGPIQRVAYVPPVQPPMVWVPGYYAYQASSYWGSGYYQPAPQAMFYPHWKTQRWHHGSRHHHHRFGQHRH